MLQIEDALSQKGAGSVVFLHIKYLILSTQVMEGGILGR